MMISLPGGDIFQLIPNPRSLPGWFCSLSLPVKDKSNYKKAFELQLFWDLILLISSLNLLRGNICKKKDSCLQKRKLKWGKISFAESICLTRVNLHCGKYASFLLVLLSDFKVGLWRLAIDEVLKTINKVTTR